MCSWRGIDVCSAGSYRVPGSQMRNSFHSCIVCLVPLAYSIVVCRSPVFVALLFCFFIYTFKPDTFAAPCPSEDCREPCVSNKEPCTLRPQRLRQPLVLRGARGGAALLDLQLDGGASPPGHRSLHTGRVGLHAGRVRLQGGASGVACRGERGCREEQSSVCSPIGQLELHRSLGAHAGRCVRPRHLHGQRRRNR